MAKKEEIEGYIFLCSDITEEECLKRSLFGGTEKYQKRVNGVGKGKKLFLYNYNSKKLSGIFEAASALRANIVKSAWSGTYPLQIRVKRTAEYVPLSREDMGSIIKFDRASRPSARLNKERVFLLEGLFKNKKRANIYADDIQYMTHDGHRVRSKAEQQIDNWLYTHRISHGYEVPVGTKRCDFEVQTNVGKVYIEYWGLKDAVYLKNKKEKELMYKENNLQLIGLHPKDLKRLDTILGKRFINV